MNKLIALFIFPLLTFILLSCEREVYISRYISNQSFDTIIIQQGRASIQIPSFDTLLHTEALHLNRFVSEAKDFDTNTYNFAAIQPWECYSIYSKSGRLLIKKLSDSENWDIEMISETIYKSTFIITEADLQ
jgi:hypothetical protein